MKTQQEIRARFDMYRDGGAKDLLGFRQGALLEVMEFATIADIAKEGAIAASWHKVDVEKTARSYLAFAIGKAVDHRGISASRSIEKLAEWLWVLGDEKLAALFEAADYYPYGGPQLAVLETAWQVEHEHKDDEDWRLMRAGRHCTADYGCGC